MHIYHHVAGMISYIDIGIAGDVLEEVIDVKIRVSIGSVYTGPIVPMPTCMVVSTARE